MEYETALKATPNRYRVFLGVARAADAAGNRAKAIEYYGKVVELSKKADTGRRHETRRRFSQEDEPVGKRRATRILPAAASDPCERS